MTDLSPETNQLLGLAREAGGLSEARRAHIKAGLFTQIVAVGLGVGATSVATGAGASATATATVSAAAGKVAWLSSSLVKVVSALALLSVTGVSVYAVVQAKSAPAVAPPAAAAGPAAPVVHAAAAVAAPSPVSDAPAPAASAPSAVAPGERSLALAPRIAGANASPAPAVLNAETLAEETRLLRDADQALRAGNAARALTLLDEHATRFPRGALAPERVAESLIARCQLHQSSVKVARGYLAGHANSAFAARIRDACGVTD